MLYASDKSAFTGSRGGLRLRPAKSNVNPFETALSVSSSPILIIPAKSSKYTRAADPSIPSSTSSLTCPIFCTSSIVSISEAQRRDSVSPFARISERGGPGEDRGQGERSESSQSLDRGRSRPETPSGRRRETSPVPASCCLAPTLRRGWPISQGAVRPLGVVELPPLLDHHVCLFERIENLSIQTLVSQLPVERFAVSVLPGTPRLDEERLGAHRGHPLPHSPCGHLRAVVRSHMLRHAVLQHAVAR